MGEGTIGAAGGDRDRDGDATGGSGGERDYGDSAGYGGGGSTLDYDELMGDENAGRDLGRPNPLDAVVHTDRDGEEGGSGGDSGPGDQGADPASRSKA